MPTRKPAPTTTLTRKQWQRERTQTLKEAAEILSRVYIPAQDHEPPYSAELVDRYGSVWIRDHRRADGGWFPEGAEEYAVKWSSPAMQNAGPFVSRKKRTPDQIRAHKAKAANGRAQRDAAA